MKKQHLILSILILFLALNSVNAQIENEIRSYTDSIELLVTNGRKLIMQHIQTNDLKKVAEIYDYLVLITEEKNCRAFTYNEDIFIASIMYDWNGFFNHAAHMSETKKVSLCYQIITLSCLNFRNYSKK